MKKKTRLKIERSQLYVTNGRNRSTQHRLRTTRPFSCIRTRRNNSLRRSGKNCWIELWKKHIIEAVHNFGTLKDWLTKFLSTLLYTVDPSYKKEPVGRTYIFLRFLSFLLSELTFHPHLWKLYIPCFVVLELEDCHIKIWIVTSGRKKIVDLFKPTQSRRTVPEEKPKEKRFYSRRTENIYLHIKYANSEQYWLL